MDGQIKAANRLVATIANPGGASKLFGIALIHYGYEGVVEVYRKDFDRRVWLLDHVCHGDDIFEPADGDLGCRFERVGELGAATV
jgi:hypothetical protein